MSLLVLQAREIRVKESLAEVLGTLTDASKKNTYAKLTRDASYQLDNEAVLINPDWVQAVYS